MTAVAVPACTFIPLLFLFFFLGIVPYVNYTDVLSVPPLEYLPGDTQLYTQNRVNVSVLFGQTHEPCLACSSVIRDQHSAQTC